MVQSNNLGDPNYDCDSNGDEDWKNETIKVETRNNYVVILEESKNDDPFYFVSCDKPLHRCETTFTHGWGNI